MRFSKFLPDRGGATAVEFGLTAVPFILLVFGIMEFGRAAWTREALAQASIAGARCMGLGQPDCASSGLFSASMTTSFIQSQAAKWSVSVPTSNITLNPTATCGGLTGFSQVSITYSFPTFLPQLLPALAAVSSLSMSACYPNHP